MATCTWSGTKHDLNRINQKPSELLRSYIRCFFEMRNSIPNITEAEIITASSIPSSTASHLQASVR